MNKAIIVGRLTRDPEIRYSTGSEPMAIANFTLAVPRWNDEEADFIRCVAFGKKESLPKVTCSREQKLSLKAILLQVSMNTKTDTPYSQQTLWQIPLSLQKAIKTKIQKQVNQQTKNHIRKGDNHYDKERTGSI